MSDETNEERPIPKPQFTRDDFLLWRSPRPGRTNPERMTNPVWTWLVESGLDAFAAVRRFEAPSSFEAGPAWCFSRFGRTETRLPDGRVLLIAGEHEDHYDPDFQIYNDVVVRHPDGRIEILGYPEEDFPPTDFHSATLVGSRLILVGSLGYPHQRRHGETQVMSLDVESLVMTRMETAGAGPGWIHAHTAELLPDGDAIVIRGGEIDSDKDSGGLTENIDDWRLDLRSRNWERLTDRRWPRWTLTRQDRGHLHLFEYQMAAMAREFGFSVPVSPEFEEQLGSGTEADRRLELYRRRNEPSVSHVTLPRDPEGPHGLHLVEIDGVRIRIREELCSVTVTVEGNLPDPTLERLREDGLRTLTLLEQAPCRCELVGVCRV